METSGMPAAAVAAPVTPPAPVPVATVPAVDTTQAVKP
jgi:hypothetical protein